jgi:hypothetical protein
MYLCYILLSSLHEKCGLRVLKKETQSIMEKTKIYPTSDRTLSSQVITIGKIASNLRATHSGRGTVRDRN